MLENYEEFIKYELGDVDFIKYVLQNSGIVNYEQIVINKLLNITYDYVAAILEDATVLANHANRTELDKSDICLSLTTKQNQCFISGKDLNEFANKVNSVNLPEIKPGEGVRLPSEHYSLTQCNYRLIQKPEINTKQLSKVCDSGSKHAKCEPLVIKRE